MAVMLRGRDADGEQEINSNGSKLAKGDYVRFLQKESKRQVRVTPRNNELDFPLMIQGNKHQSAFCGPIADAVNCSEQSIKYNGFCSCLLLFVRTNILYSVYSFPLFCPNPIYDSAGNEVLVPNSTAPAAAI